MGRLFRRTDTMIRTTSILAAVLFIWAANPGAAENAPPPSIQSPYLLAIAHRSSAKERTEAVHS